MSFPPIQSEASWRARCAREILEFSGHPRPSLPDGCTWLACSAGAYVLRETGAHAIAGGVFPSELDESWRVVVRGEYTAIAARTLANAATLLAWALRAEHHAAFALGMPLRVDADGEIDPEECVWIAAEIRARVARNEWEDCPPLRVRGQGHDGIIVTDSNGRAFWDVLVEHAVSMGRLL